MDPFDPFKVTNDIYTEANAWQYTWSVMHDFPALIEMMGGPAKFEEKLDALWTAKSDTAPALPDVTGLIGNYAHGNEPSHHIAYLYDLVGKPWKTQAHIREIMKLFYNEKRDGLCGNEDCGQMSAWFVFSALGFYPVNPASGVYLIGSPVFPSRGNLGAGRQEIRHRDRELRPGQRLHPVGDIQRQAVRPRVDYPRRTARRRNASNS